MFCAYFLLRKTRAATATIAMTTIAAIITYVSMANPPVGGGAVVGVAVACSVGVGVAGAIVAVGVGVICGLIGGASVTPSAVSACDGQ